MPRNSNKVNKIAYSTVYTVVKGQVHTLKIMTRVHNSILFTQSTKCIPYMPAVAVYLEKYEEDKKSQEERKEGRRLKGGQSLL